MQMSTFSRKLATHFAKMVGGQMYFGNIKQIIRFETGFVPKTLWVGILVNFRKFFWMVLASCFQRQSKQSKQKRKLFHQGEGADF